MPFQDNSKNVYLGSKSSTLYPGIGNPALQLLFLCNLPHTFQLSGSPFSWFGLQSWILSNLHYFCFPQSWHITSNSLRTSDEVSIRTGARTNIYRLTTNLGATLDIINVHDSVCAYLILVKNRDIKTISPILQMKKLRPRNHT